MLRGKISSRWLALRLLEGEEELIRSAQQYLGGPALKTPAVQEPLSQARELLEQAGLTEQALRDEIVSGLVRQAERICAHAVESADRGYSSRDRKIDRVLTSKATASPS